MRKALREKINYAEIGTCKASRFRSEVESKFSLTKKSWNINRKSTGIISCNSIFLNAMNGKLYHDNKKL